MWSEQDKFCEMEKIKDLLRTPSTLCSLLARVAPLSQNLENSVWIRVRYESAYSYSYWSGVLVAYVEFSTRIN